MKAIVMTYDRNAVLTDHMIACYRQLWPDHPFIFNIPYQHAERCIEGHDRKYIKTLPDIKITVLQLLSELDDEEWIYWCIDDRYPVNLDIVHLRKFVSLVEKEDDPGFSGLLLCRASTMLRENQLTDINIRRWDINLLERKKYYRIWVHQFLRVKVIRTMFLGFPDVIERAGLMDPMKNKLVRPPDQMLYVTEQDYAHFEESTINGVLTEKCHDSLLSHGFDIPEWFRGKTTPNPALG
jgi:hypothetical protein